MCNVSDENGQNDEFGCCSFSALAHKILDARSQADLESVLRVGLQRYVSHDALIFIYGNFRLGVLHYDLLSGLDDSHGEGLEAGELTPEFVILFEQWIAKGRRPLRLDAERPAVSWSRSNLQLSNRAALQRMNGVVLHGIHDQRGSNDCLYAFFSQSAIPSANDERALKVLVPLLDAAIRQVEVPARAAQPHPAIAHTDPVASVGAHTDELSERESEIMRWVAVGKTNLEIGEILNLSSFTIKNDMQRIFRKLDVFNRTQAVAMFRVRHGRKS